MSTPSTLDAAIDAVLARLQGEGSESLSDLRRACPAVAGELPRAVEVLREQGRVHVSVGRSKDPLLSLEAPRDLITTGRAELLWLPVEQVLLDPQLARSVPDTEEELEGLAATIRAVDVLDPLLVRRDEQGRYWLIAGDRRLRAARRAGKREVPVRVLSVRSPDQVLRLRLVEQLHTQELHPLDLADLVERLMRGGARTAAEVAAELGHTVSWVSRVRAVATSLDPAARAEAARAGLSLAQLYQVTLAERCDQAELVRRTAAEGLGCRALAAGQGRRTPAKGRTVTIKCTHGVRVVHPVGLSREQLREALAQALVRLDRGGELPRAAA